MFFIFKAGNFPEIPAHENSIASINLRLIKQVRQQNYDLREFWYATKVAKSNSV